MSLALKYVLQFKQTCPLKHALQFTLCPFEAITIPHPKNYIGLNFSVNIIWHSFDDYVI